MNEKIEVYDLEANLLKIQDRVEFYHEIKQEYRDSWKITKKIKSIRLILLNSSGDIYLQKRNKNKSENGGLYDKSVWGHVKSSDSYDLTAVKECAEELGFPATILSEQDFESAISDTDLSIVWLFRKIDFLDNFISIRNNKDGSQIAQPFLSSIYIWYYDAPIQFVDGESSWIEVFSLQELKQEIIDNPDKFTQDIKFMIDAYSKYLTPIS